jgi:hypothetical protein
MTIVELERAVVEQAVVAPAVNDLVDRLTLPDIK